jgi:hypothetical protein
MLILAHLLFPLRIAFNNHNDTSSGILVHYYFRFGNLVQNSPVYDFYGLFPKLFMSLLQGMVAKALNM